MSTEYGEWQIITPIQEHISVIQVKYIHVHNSSSYINNIFFFKYYRVRDCSSTCLHYLHIYHCNILQWLQKSKFLKIFRWSRNWIKKQPAQQRTKPRSAWAISSPRGWQRISKFTSRMFFWYNLSWAHLQLIRNKMITSITKEMPTTASKLKSMVNNIQRVGNGENGTSSKMAGHFRFDLITQLRPGRKMETNWTFWNLVHVPWTQEQYFGPNIQRSTPYVASVKD